MKLTVATVGPFRSITTPQRVAIDPAVTVLVGMNEAGKTVFLKGLEKARDVLGDAKFNPTDDYPRKDYTSYMKRHAASPDVAVVLTYQPTSEQIDKLNLTMGLKLKQGFSFSVSHTYLNTQRITISVDEAPSVLALSSTAGLSGDAVAAIKSGKSLRAAIAALEAIERTDVDDAFLATQKARAAKTEWANVTEHEVWSSLSKLVPKHMYFSDYDILPGKMNLSDLALRVSGNKPLTASHKSILALLRMADVSVADFSGSTGYEELKAKVEAVSISLTDQVLEFWKQNEDLEVEVDIRPDPADEPPFNTGPNLYLRIKNRRHRGVTTPFDQRSRGFIWFFSFLVWFDSVQGQLALDGNAEGSRVILLLDEPGLALHALAQADFLSYIDSLALQHQVIYTTHSPFMVHADRLHQVRVVEDKQEIGTVISSDLGGSDSRTIFPLQAALGWNVAQNLFISKRNLLVEGPSELAYLAAVSAIFEGSGETGLRQDVTVVPTGGLGNVATFVSLLGANGLKLAVLLDYAGSPDQKLENLVRQKLLAQKSVFTAAQFRSVAGSDAEQIPSDFEDLFSVPIYLQYFNAAFSTKLGAKLLKESDLPPGDRVVERIDRALHTFGTKLRPSGGFNHYLVAAEFGRNPPKALDSETLTRFKALFEAINRAF